MKIGKIRTTVVSVPQKRAYKSSWRRGYQGSAAQTAVLVELTTDDGLTGIGEAPVVYAGRPEVTVALIDGVKDLLLRSRSVRPRHRSPPDLRRDRDVNFGTQGLSWALSGIDTALWIWSAKRAASHSTGCGVRWTQSPFYGDIPAGNPAEMAEEAKEWVARGFRTLYFKVGFGPDLDVARARAVRKAVGDVPRLGRSQPRLVTGRCAPGDRQAGRVRSRGHRAARARVEPGGHGLRSPDVTSPILAHEASLTVDGSLNVIKHQAADALQLDPASTLVSPARASPRRSPRQPVCRL